MLAARGISEAFVANPDQALIRDSLLSALDSGKNRYSCTTDQLFDLLVSLVELANTGPALFRLPLLTAIQKSSAVDQADKDELWEQIRNYSTGWDYVSKLCISAITAETLINDAIRGAADAVKHFADIQRELN